jgi:hypothetical protein
MILAGLHHSRHSLPVITGMNESIKKSDRFGRLRYAPKQKKAMVYLIMLFEYVGSFLVVAF